MYPLTMSFSSSFRIATVAELSKAPLDTNLTVVVPQPIRSSWVPETSDTDYISATFTEEILMFEYFSRLAGMLKYAFETLHYDKVLFKSYL